MAGLHTWIKMSYVPLIVEAAKANPKGGSFTVKIDKVSAEVAEDEALMNCWHCHTPLNNETFNTPCIPEDSPQEN